MGNPLDRVRLPVGKVVHRVDAPFVASAMMMRLQDAIEHGVAHVDVGRRHVDVGAQRVLPVLEFPRPHSAKQIETFRGRPIAIGAGLARFGERAPVFTNLLAVQAADVGVSFLNELFGPFVELLEVVRRVEFAVFPGEAQPADVFLDRVDVLDVFLRRVRVVEPQIALAAKFLRDAEVEADRLGVADVQVAVGLGRKASHHLAAVFARLLILGHDAADEIELGGGRWSAVGHIRDPSVISCLRRGAALAPGRCD